jgi:hypothetical protein
MEIVNNILGSNTLVLQQEGLIQRIRRSEFSTRKGLYNQSDLPQSCLGYTVAILSCLYARAFHHVARFHTRLAFC